MTSMRMDLSPRMSQVQVMSPRMYQSMEILQMPIMDLQEKIQQELNENPVLELAEPGDESGESGESADFDETPEPRDDRDPGAKELVIDEAHGNELDFD